MAAGGRARKMATFGARSTGTDVLRGVDLSGKTAIVTGAALYHESAPSCLLHPVRPLLPSCMPAPDLPRALQLINAAMKLLPCSGCVKLQNCLLQAGRPA